MADSGNISFRHVHVVGASDDMSSSLVEIGSHEKEMKRAKR